MRTIVLSLIILSCQTCLAQTPTSQIISQINQIGNGFSRIAGEPTDTVAIKESIISINQHLEEAQRICEGYAIGGMDLFFSQIKNATELIKLLTNLYNPTEKEKDQARLLLKDLAKFGAQLNSINTLDILPPENSALIVIDSVFSQPLSNSESDTVVVAKNVSQMAVDVDCCGFIEEWIESGSDWIGEQISNMTPDELENWATQTLGQGLLKVGEAVYLLNEQGQRLTTISVKTINFFKQLEDNKNDFIKKTANALSLATGTKLPTVLERQYARYFNAHDKIILQSFDITCKAMNMTHNAIKEGSLFLQTLGKYLLLASKGFPEKVFVKEQSLANSKAIVQIDRMALRRVIKYIAKDNYSSNQPGLSLLAMFNGVDIQFDDKTNTFIAILNNANLRASHPYNMKLFGANIINEELSGTITIKSVKIQLIPELINADIPTIRFTGRIISLDIKDLMPKLDQMVAWVVQKELISKLAFNLEVGDIVKTDLKIRGASPDSIRLNTGAFENKFSIKTNDFLLAYLNNKENKYPVDPELIQKDDIAIQFNGSFLKDFLDTILKNNGGLKITLDKDVRKKGEFDSSFNYLHLRKINSTTIDQHGAKLDFTVQVHYILKKFLGKDRKFNIEISNAVFYLKPFLQKRNKFIWEIGANLELAPDEIKISGVPQKVSKKVLNILKRWRQPIKIGKYVIKPPDMGPYEIDPISLEDMQTMEFKHPFKPGKKIKLNAENLRLKYSNNCWALLVHISLQ